MVIEKFLIKSFANVALPQYDVVVPDGAVFTHVVKVLPDGIYAFYRVHKLISPDFHKKEVFVVLKTGEEIPSNFDLVDILDVVYQRPSQEGSSSSLQEGVILFHVFKKA